MISTSAGPWTGCSLYDPNTNHLHRMFSSSLERFKCRRPNRVVFHVYRSTCYGSAVSLLSLCVGAELRGTGSQPWRGMAPGSRKHHGYFAAGASQPTALVLCESAIDAISCAALHPGYKCLSTAGINDNPQWLTQLISCECRLFCGFDSDPPGEAAAQRLIRRFPCIQRLKPSDHDWNLQLQRY